MGGADQHGDLPDPKIVMRLLAQLSCNSHSICENTLDSTGVILGEPPNTPNMSQQVTNTTVQLLGCTCAI